MKKLFYRGPSFSDLHENYAKQRTIDTNAGSQALDSVDIHAPAEAVWSVLINVEKWPAFNAVVSDVKVPSRITPDAQGSFKLNGFPVALTFAIVDENRELSWTGKSLWTKAIDRLWIEKKSGGTTRLHLDESLAGVLVPLMSSGGQLHRQHQASLKSFKAAAEALPK